MTPQRMAQWMGAMQTLAKPGQVVQLSFVHDNSCPCLKGKPLPACACDPWLQVNGTRYEMDDDGKLRVLQKLS